MKKKIWVLSGSLLLAAVIAGLIFLLTSLDYIVKSAIEKFSPRFTHTAVKVGSVNIGLRNGECRIKRFLIGNPKGFRTDYAFKVDVVDVGIEPASVTKKVLHIRKIVVLAPHVNYESQSGGNNLESIQRHIDQSLGAEKQAAKKNKKDKSPEKKMMVDALVLRNVKVTYTSGLLGNTTAELTLPSIEMYNIGKNKGGVTGGELAKLVVQELSTRIAKVVGAAALKGGTTDLLKGLIKQ